MLLTTRSFDIKDTVSFYITLTSTSMAIFWLSLCFPLLYLTAVAIPDKDGLSRISSSSNKLNIQFQSLLSAVRQLYPHISQGKIDVWEMAQIAALCSLFPGFFYLRRKRKESSSNVLWNSTDSIGKEGMANGSSAKKSMGINGEPV